MRSWLALAFLILLGSVPHPVRADEIVPNKPGDKVPLVIAVDDKAAPAKLTVPKELVATMRAALDDADGKTFARATPTVAAGLSLSLALAFGGVWLMRHRAGHGTKNLALLVAGAALLAVTGASVLADAGIGKKRTPLPASELVVVTVVNQEGAPITLTITKDKLTKAIEAARKPEPK